jgi:hypothetical protein
MRPADRPAHPQTRLQAGARHRRWNPLPLINHNPLGRDATVTDGGGKSDGVTTTITILGTKEGLKAAYKTKGRAGSYVEVTRTVTLPTGSLVG